MNPMTGQPDASAPGGSAGAPRIDRLWPALSRSVKREQPAAGLDLLGERVKAAASRKNAGRELRLRAERIIGSARALRDMGERALEERIGAARELAATRFDEAATLDSAYAVMYEVVRRELAISLYPEQLMGALGLATRTIVEMATGEGKTLTAGLGAALGVLGMTAEEVEERRAAYNPWDIYRNDDEIHRAMEMLQHDFFNLMEPGIFQRIYHALLDGDRYMLLGDLRSYADCQQTVDALYKSPKLWDRKAILNVARAGRFSSDRTIQEYAREIWRVEPCEIQQGPATQEMHAGAAGTGPT